MEVAFIGLSLYTVFISLRLLRLERKFDEMRNRELQNMRRTGSELESGVVRR